MYHGIINVYKEKGYTSHDVVAILRGVLKQKKIGHTGTLDPEATGVLPICLGKGTKVAGMLTDKDKTYRTSFILGQETDTQDHTGAVVNELAWDVTEKQVMDTLASFTGPIDQVPPMYSAVKVNGRKLYDLAREGKTVERKSRSIVIHNIKDVTIDLPMISMTVQCSKGTYIRTLCRDIAEHMGTCGHMTSLERVQSGSFLLETAKSLDEIKEYTAEGSIQAYIIPVDWMFADYDSVIINKSYDKLLENGNKMPEQSFVTAIDKVDSRRYNVYNEEGDYMGLYEWNDSKQLLVPIKLFFIRKREDHL